MCVAAEDCALCFSTSSTDLDTSLALFVFFSVQGLQTRLYGAQLPFSSFLFWSRGAFLLSELAACVCPVADRVRAESRHGTEATLLEGFHEDRLREFRLSFQG